MFSVTIRSSLRTTLVPKAQLHQLTRPINGNKLLISKSLIGKQQQQKRFAGHHHEETFEEFTARYEQEFEQAYDLFEVQRILNNCFAYDLVPAPAVIEKALLACRRVNDYPTAVRTFEALKHKVENKQQYQAYLDELKDVRQELGIDLKEDLYGDDA